MIDFANLDAYFDHDNEDVVSFLTIVIEDWQQLRADIVVAATTLNEKKYGDVTHKMISVLRLTGATELQTVLQQLRTAFKSADQSAIDRQLPATLAVFDEVLEEMKQRVASI